MNDAMSIILNNSDSAVIHDAPQVSLTGGIDGEHRVSPSPPPLGARRSCGEDPRMRLTLPRRARELPHTYIVTLKGMEVLRTQCRHSALQVYLRARTRLNDFAELPPPDGIRIFCDDKEWFDGVNSSRSWLGKPAPRERIMP